MKSTISKEKQTWNSIAEKWNQHRKNPYPLIKKFLSDKKGKILDLGCGSGRNFSAFQTEEIYASDFSENMISLAEKKAKTLNKKIRTYINPSDNLPFKNNFFDSLICIAVLHCIPSEQKRIKTLKEIHRVLKPNSKALITTWSKNSSRLKNKPKSCFIPWTINQTKEQRYTYTYNLKELEKQLLDTGFKIIKIWQDKNINAIVEKL